ncbi:MAG TPA: hypothetical protein VKU80_15565 [Planctomycetota bacterium]|nr:hypothetical protein [Planctomycetota bacterium]
MNKTLLLSFFLAGAGASAAAAQESTDPLWTDLGGTRTFPSFQEQGGPVVEEWYSPKLRTSLSVFGRVSFPSDTRVTSDGLWYSDFFGAGYGVSVEGDLLSFVTPHLGAGGYLSVGWDRFGGQTLNFSNGDFAKPDALDLSTVIVGGKIVQRISPFVTWEGRMGLGLVHYSKVDWSGFDSGGVPPGPFSNEELFRPINRGVFELGGRVGVGNRQVQADFGFGFRYMGGAARGRDVSAFVDPDPLYTFLLELGLTIRL